MQIFSTAMSIIFEVLCLTTGLAEVIVSRLLPSDIGAILRLTACSPSENST